jgi:muramoyltetrapeptide carboxypeptidase
MTRRRLHLLAVAGPCRRLLPALKCKSAEELIALVQTVVGDGFHVTGEKRLIESVEDVSIGGRHDDAVRAADIQQALGDDEVAAVVALRGGSWLTRILPRIDFEVLKKRRTRIAIFGFSELSTIINITARYDSAVCYYDYCPAFIRPGMMRYGLQHLDEITQGRIDDPLEAEVAAGRWAKAQFADRFKEFFRDAVNMLRGGGSNRSIVGRLVQGALPKTRTATFAGGNLSVIAALLGTPYDLSLDLKNRWLLIEDINEWPHRIDRHLAHFSISGRLADCDGILVGDFHDENGDQNEWVISILRHHLPAANDLPIVQTAHVGHIWPLSPLPIGRGVPLTLNESGEVGFRIPWSELAVVS